MLCEMEIENNFLQVFLHSILSIFFSSVEVIGKQNIPPHGPIIFTGNHMNQFVDAVIILVTTPLKVGFLVAEKSFNKPIIGHFAKAVGSIPVSRPQDQAVKGVGQVKINGDIVHGIGTNFTSLKKGDKIRPGRFPDGFAIKSIVSDTELVISECAAIRGEQNVGMDYDVLKGVDQSKVSSVGAK
jgi:glycerol-3-phosphate O-acyltransferase / dihydroxyacetone phosphate acyltransferase